MFENQLRQAVEMRRQRLIAHLKALTVTDETVFDQLTLSELEKEWSYYFESSQTEEVN